MRINCLVNAAATLALSAAIIITAAGCGDMGADLPTGPPPAVTTIVPDTGDTGDTVRISGNGFGDIRASNFVRFGGIEASTYIDWQDTLIVVVVPANASSGPVTVTVGTATGGGTVFTVKGTTVTLRSFATDVLPRLTRYGCVGCHGGSGGLFVDTQPHLLQGGVHGPAVVPGNAAASLLIQKLSPNPPFGSRMPQGGSALADTTIQVIREWIDQGALNN